MVEKSGFPAFSSRLAFILVTAGAAVGLGNIWGFTYVAGKNGGGGFVLIYLLALAFVAAPVFMAELLLGRMGRASPPKALKKLQNTVGDRVPWAAPAWLGLVSTILILSFYSVIAGQAMAYGLEALKGGFAGWSNETIQQLDRDFKAGATLPALWSAIFMASTALIVSFDIRKGIEVAGRIMMPAFFLMLLGLVIYAAIEGDFVAGFKFMFGFNDIQLSPRVLLEAVGQAFFTLSVGVGGVMVYGAYMGSDVDLPRAAFWIVIMDLAVALLAGLAIFPLVFGEGVDAAAGPGLVFITLPIIFSNVTGGTVVAFVFFLLLTFAAITSSISLLSPATQRLVEAGWQRGRAAWLMAGLAFLLSFLTVFSFNVWQDFYPLAGVGLEGLTFFDLIREGVSNFVLPLSGLAFSVMVGWRLGRRDVMAAMPIAEGLTFRLWYFALRYIVPVAISLLFLTAIFGG